MEAIDKDGTIERQLPQEQCARYAAFFNIADEDFVAVSYSDLVMQQQGNATKYMMFKQNGYPACSYIKQKTNNEKIHSFTLNTFIYGIFINN